MFFAAHRTSFSLRFVTDYDMAPFTRDLILAYMNALAAGDTETVVAV